MDSARQDRWLRALRGGPLDAADGFRLLRDYGIRAARAQRADSGDAALAAAGKIGYPVVLKTAEPGVAHKSDAGGVVLGIRDAAGARRMLSRLRVARLLAGFRGRPPASLGAVTAAITGVSAIACELGGALAALDVNPVICGAGGAVAVDVLVEPAAG